MVDQKSIYIGKNSLTSIRKNEIKSGFIRIGDDAYNQITNVNQLPPFFMSMVSDSNHWMFISSTGGLTAGRKNADYALFPYYTDDKISESAEYTGNKSIFLVHKENRYYLWEPFSDRYEGIYHISRNLYKSIYGNKIIFEEFNHDLKLRFRYQWNSSNLFGFVKRSILKNESDTLIEISLLDGIQNIVPYGIGAELQTNTSNLADAYKRSELIKTSGLGIYALSAIIVDKAEPSEALKANIVWSLGLEDPKYLLSSRQLKNFRTGKYLSTEVDVKAERGAYFVNAEISLPERAEKEWMIIANVNQSQSSIIDISEQIVNKQNLHHSVLGDIQTGTQNLIRLTAAADGLQTTKDKPRNVRHFSNTLFNIMRGGVFDDNYKIERGDFKDYIAKANRKVFSANLQHLKNLPAEFDLFQMERFAEQSEDSDLQRLCHEYLPLKFSRRHGDPSRPWNEFSINTRSETDGSKILDYEGNWRDIFQNWEALAYSYPLFTESMIHKFLNASTFDGYNPYRITKDGFDWETIEPDNPWSYIGYWGDHQIIYLLKLLELWLNQNPQKAEDLFSREIFVYANVPYRIKDYAAILQDPKDTIEFDSNLDHQIKVLKNELGADAALLRNKNGGLHYVTFIEKILATVLAKLSNFIPEGGIWMNTQRPEWNDANNALVGNGVSMVTLYYLRRFLHFFEEIFSNSSNTEVLVSEELAGFFYRMAATFDQFKYILEGPVNDEDRKRVLDGLGQAGSDYHSLIYKEAFSGRKVTLSISEINNFFRLSKEYMEHSIRANKRTDDLYHAYNLMTLTDDHHLSISYLSEMLEGQVAALSSGYLSDDEVVNLLDSLKKSKLYQKDQNSYMLYPDNDLPGFLEKNNIPESSVIKSELLKKLINDGNTQIIDKDKNGGYHFNGNFRNVGDLKTALAQFIDTDYSSLAEKDNNLLLSIFEEVFNHKEFTGRSGTFFGYEGLGSIYWHMVSKLQLAVQERCLKAIEDCADTVRIDSLVKHYYEINEGIGAHKSPEEYGAFSTDPYSHTPSGKGVKQPGMTGQVKEDILSRIGELGISIHKGQIYFKPYMLKKGEFLTESETFKYVDVRSASKHIKLNRDSLAFTYCQVPVIYRLAGEEQVEVNFADGKNTMFNSLKIDEKISKKIFKRTAEVIEITVFINELRLK